MTSPFSNIASFVRMPRISGIQTSPSGTTVLTRRVVSEDQASFVDQLFAVTDEGARQLTFGYKSASLLAVGSRGEVYFSRTDDAEKEKGDALWMLPPQGEAREIFRYRGGISALKVADSGLLLQLSVLDPENEGERFESIAAELQASADLRKARSDGKVSGFLQERFPLRFWDQDLGPGHERLFSSPLPPLVRELDLTSEVPEPPKAKDDKGESKPSTGELHLTEVPLPPRPEGSSQWGLESVSLTRDGSRAIVEMSTRTTIDTFQQVWSLDLTNGSAPTLLAADEDSDWFVIAVSPDGTWVALGQETPPLPGQPLNIGLFRVDLETTHKSLLLEHFMGEATISPEGNIYLAEDRLGRGGVFRLLSSGQRTLLTPDDEYAYSSLKWANGKLVALRSSIAEPATLVTIDPLSGEVSEGPALTPELELPGELTEIHANAEDGTALRAWLAVPEGDGPHPLVVFAHGGPWGSWSDWTWRWNPWIFVERGYAVLLPDPGISTGYGPEMIARGHDSIGNEPFTDIMALTDEAVARPDIDAGRQAFTGGSYGGYMANWVAGHTGERFRCIVTHASLWNIESMGRTTDNGSWYRWMSGPVPSSAGEYGPAQVDLWSPHAFAEAIKVPMLVIHGDKDYRVPFAQGLELWMDLHRLSPDLGHQFLYFPDEGHWILRPGNAQLWYETFVAFLDKHLMGEESGKTT